MTELRNGCEVAVVAGSDSDAALVKEAVAVLRELGIAADMRVLSAHRSPEEAGEFAAKARKSGYGVIIAVAGGAAHLAGALAARTTLPVIGVPAPTDLLGGLDSLLSTVQMPAGVPVAAVGVGKAGARNAGFLAAEILALKDKGIAKKLVQHREKMAEEVHAKEERLKGKLREES